MQESEWVSFWAEIGRKLILQHQTLLSLLSLDKQQKYLLSTLHFIFKHFLSGNSPMKSVLKTTVLQCLQREETGLWVMTMLAGSPTPNLISLRGLL